MLLAHTLEPAGPYTVPASLPRARAPSRIAFCPSGVEYMADGVSAAGATACASARVCDV